MLRAFLNVCSSSPLFLPLLIASRPLPFPSCLSKDDWDVLPLRDASGFPFSPLVPLDLYPIPPTCSETHLSCQTTFLLLLLRGASIVLFIRNPLDAFFSFHDDQFVPFLICVRFLVAEQVWAPSVSCPNCLFKQTLHASHFFCFFFSSQCGSRRAPVLVFSRLFPFGFARVASPREFSFFPPTHASPLCAVAFKHWGWIR